MAAKRHDVWAVTSYFNPMGYQSRLRNYRVFRRNLNVPLVTVEAAFNGKYQLSVRDADRLIQVPMPHVMWQKERLLNIGLDALPGQCQVVAWLDCDVVFEDPGWASKALAALDGENLIHLFDTRLNLPKGALPGDVARIEPMRQAESMVSRIVRGAVCPDDFSPDAPVRVASTAGLAWAARVDVIRRHRLYDACVLGSGDRAVLLAGLGVYKDAKAGIQMNTAWRCHYLRWANQFFEDIKGRVNYIEGRVFHLWHGNMINRQYVQRHDLLTSALYDPDEDIALDAGGCWRWVSNKRQLQQSVHAYFEHRCEDDFGATVPETNAKIRPVKEMGSENNYR